MSKANAEKTEAHTVSMKIDDMTLDELVQLTQGLGHEIETMRQKRAYVKRKIDERLATHERTGDKDRATGRARMLEMLAKAAGEGGVAQGADIEVQTKN